MGQVWQGKLEKIDDYRWKIPASYKPGMKVPGLIYANESLIPSILKDNALEQVANVAFLPGIIKYSLAMPDIHWGYGFCLTKDAKVLTNLGFYKEIEDFEKDWINQYLRSIDLNFKKPIEASILKFMKLKSKDIFIVATKMGHEIKATGDHPLLTPSGMKPIRELSFGEKVAIYPFKGIPYQRSSEGILISEKDIKKTLLKITKKPCTPRFEIILQKLKNRDLLPLTYGHPKLPYILKIMAFIFGDGSMNFIGKRRDGILHFSGKAQDLKEVRKDIKKIGYTPSPIHYQRIRSSHGNNKYYECHSFVVNASSLVVLLETLGAPRGNKVHQAYRVPKWIFKTPLWQKRLFLASLFGCELRMPHRRLYRRGYFNAPVFSMHKKEELIENGREFLNDIVRVLREFGVKTSTINQRKKHINTKGEISWALELIVSPKPENLFNLWGKIGFEYNLERSFKANVATQYIKLKNKILKEKEEAIKVKIPQLLEKKLSYQKIAFQLAGNPLTKRFIIDVCCKLNKGKKIIPRVTTDFPLFEDYLTEVTQGLGHSGMVWDEIGKIEKVSYKDFVYDFTVSHQDHNFIANNFIVSNCIGGVAAVDPEKNGVIAPGGIGYDINCGVRLLRSDLTLKDIKPKLENLINSLFSNIPCGVGSSGDIKVSDKEEEEIFVKGAGWAIKKGYGVKEDLEYTEDKGCMEGADPSKVSERAYERGRKQSGTLGSGNHFLELQVVDEIYDSKIADLFGIFKGQLTVMIHSGSRGLGYQICDDYVKGMVQCLNKYNINVPDRQLACAPIDSPEGKSYFASMKCAANYAWANRQCLMYLARLVFEKVFNKSWSNLGLGLVYDVAHNIAKMEKHKVDGKEKLLCVHRKGATRAYPAGHPDIPLKYKDAGQPVIIPGDMGTFSYVLAGTPGAMEETFGSTCFTGDTKILTNAGIMSLQEIHDMYKIGITFEVASVEPNNFTFEWKPIIDVFKRQAEVIQINVSQTNRSKNGILKLTPDHKVSTFNNVEFVFKEIGSILDNNEMLCVLDTIDSLEKEHAPSLAYLAGVLFTDGYINLTKRRGRVVFTQKKTLEKLEFISYVAHTFLDIFGTDLKEKNTKIGKGIIRGKFVRGTATDFACTQKAPAATLLKIYEDLHRWILSLDKESILNFLAGVLDGDGTWNPSHHVLEIFNNDEYLVGAVMLGCLKLGILPYISKQRTNTYIIQISEKRDLILEYTKRLKAKPRIRKYGARFFAVRQLFHDDWKTGLLKWPYLPKAERNNLMEIDKILRFLTKSNTTIKRQKLEKIMIGHLRMLRVKKIRNLSLHDVYNINVDQNHNYIVFTDNFIPIVVKNCHGAGRCLSRSAAIKQCRNRHIDRELFDKSGIIVRAKGRSTLAEEAPEAYKDVEEVVGTVHMAGISKKVARMKPLGVIKG